MKKGGSIRVVDGWSEIDALQEVWNSFVARYGGTIEEPDVTATHEWTKILSEVFNEPGKFVLMEEGGEVTGILPLYRSAFRMHRVPCRRISPLTELYAGRCAFLLKEVTAESIETLFNAVTQAAPPWDIFMFTLVEGSGTESLFLETARRHSFAFRKLSTQASPYIVLDRPWLEYLATLSKKFQSNLRYYRKKLEKAGNLVYKEYCQGSNGQEFLDAVLQIERASWKESAGTSIAVHVYQQKFYERLTSAALAKGWLSGHLLELDGDPIAYVYGLIYNENFCDLKESYKLAFKDDSPGQVLKAFVMERLIEHQVRIYDYMGLCEPYKLRWTDRSYRRNQYVLYNKTIRGRAAQLLGRVLNGAGE